MPFFALVPNIAIIKQQPDFVMADVELAEHIAVGQQRLVEVFVELVAPAESVEARPFVGAGRRNFVVVLASCWMVAFVLMGRRLPGCNINQSYLLQIIDF